MERSRHLVVGFLSIICIVLLWGCESNRLTNEDQLELAKSRGSITWGVKADTPLFGSLNIETRKIEGFEVDLASEITKEILGETGMANFVEVSSKTRIPLLKNGNIDAIIATMTITEARREVVDFSEIYFKAGQSLLVHKDSGIRSIQDLNKDSVVIGAKGSNSVTNIQALIPDMTVLELENFSEAFVALKAGQGIAVTTDNAILLGLASQDPDYIVLDETFTFEPYGMAINKGQEPLLDAINRALATLKENGVYDELCVKWLGTLSS